MRKMKKGMILAIVFILMFSTITFADIVYLKNGQVIQGEVTQRNKYDIVVKVGKNQFKYFIEEVDRIIEEKPKDPFDNISLTYPMTDELTGWKADLIIQLLEVNGTRGSIEKNIQAIIMKAPQEKKEGLKKILDINEIIGRIVPIYGKYFTEDELKTLIAFYESESGQKVIKYTPLITGEVLKATLLYFKERASL